MFVLGVHWLNQLVFLQKLTFNLLYEVHQLLFEYVLALKIVSQLT